MHFAFKSKLNWCIALGGAPSTFCIPLGCVLSSYSKKGEIERALMLDHPFWSLMTTHNIGLMFVCTFAESIDHIRFGKRESMRSDKGKESDLVCQNCLQR